MQATIKLTINDLAFSQMKGTTMKILICTLCIFLSGCVTSNYMPVGNITYPPRPNDYVIDVYLPLEAPVAVHKSVPNAKDLKTLPSAATVIGRIDTLGAPAAGWKSVISNAQRKARTLGGDALVIRYIGSHITSVDSYGGAYYGKNVSMEVVRFSRIGNADPSRTRSFGTQSYDASSDRQYDNATREWITGGTKP